MNALSVAQILGGLLLLIAGGEGLVRGASSLALRFGMSPLVVGLTVVAFATSAPELAVSLDAVLAGEPALAVGNVVGSNTANVLLVLGASAMVAALAVKVQVVLVDLPIMIGLSFLLLLLALDGRLGPLDGAVLLAILAGYLVLALRMGRRARPRVHEAPVAPNASEPPRPTPLWRDGVLVAGGVGLLVAGAGQLVAGASRTAAALGVSDLVVGLTVVAIGTSMPELATSIVAARRGERDLAVGNIVGSNIFNIGLVLGLPALVGPTGVPVPDAAIALDIPVAIAASVALLPVALSGARIARWEGGVFLTLYVAYTVYLVLTATEHDALAGFSGAMVTFVLPLIALTILAPLAVEARHARHLRRRTDT